MSTASRNPIDGVGRHLPAMSSALRPHALDEVRAWGGTRLVRGKRVLDLGCGDGRFAFAIASLAAKVDGLDPDPESIDAARRSARAGGVRNVTFEVGAAQQMPYPDGSFDVVILSWAL